MTKTDLYKEQITKAINAFSQKKFSEAEEVCLKILSVNNNPDANHILGCIRMSEGKYDESISYINNSLSVNYKNIPRIAAICGSTRSSSGVLSVKCSSQYSVVKLALV